MCGRYFIDEGEAENRRLTAILKELLEKGHPMAAQVRTGEIFPTQIAPIIVAENGRATVRPMRWGFPRGGGHGIVINSRSEKADSTPMFQKAVRERRCLVPMSGFYEWRRTPSGGKTRDKFAFRSVGAHEKGMMYLAGVYGEFLGGFENGGFDGFAILTREADEQMCPYHHRMPVIMDDEALKKLWLFSGLPYQELRRQFELPGLSVEAVNPDK